MSSTAPLPDPGAAGPTVSEVVAEVARRLQLKRAEISHAMSELLARDVTGLDDDPQLVAMLHASVEGNVSTIFHILTNDIPLEHLQPTTAAVKYAAGRLSPAVRRGSRQLDAGMPQIRLM
ncbi:hypothetical protein [Aeromicrobium sp.]